MGDEPKNELTITVPADWFTREIPYNAEAMQAAVNQLGEMREQMLLASTGMSDASQVTGTLGGNLVSAMVAESSFQKSLSNPPPMHPDRSGMLQAIEKTPAPERWLLMLDLAEWLYEHEEDVLAYAFEWAARKKVFPMLSTEAEEYRPAHGAETPFWSWGQPGIGRMRRGWAPVPNLPECLYDYGPWSLEGRQCSTVESAFFELSQALAPWRAVFA